MSTSSFASWCAPGRDQRRVEIRTKLVHEEAAIEVLVVYPPPRFARPPLPELRRKPESALVVAKNTVAVEAHAKNGVCQAPGRRAAVVQVDQVHRYEAHIGAPGNSVQDDAKL